MSLSGACQGCQTPWPTSGPEGRALPSPTPPPQHVAGLHIQDTPRPPTSACVSPLGKSRPHVCPEAQAPSVCPPISAHFLDCLSSQ